MELNEKPIINSTKRACAMDILDLVGLVVTHIFSRLDAASFLDRLKLSVNSASA
jgi:hypothetical protein